MRKVLYILGQLEDSDLQWMVEAGNPTPVSAGTSIIDEGVRLDTLFLVLDGQLAVTVAAQPGKEIARLGAGEIVGEMSLLDSRPANATVTATQDSRVYGIPHDKVKSKLRTDAAFAARFYRALCIFLANRLNRTVTMIGSGASPSLEEDVQEGDEISPEALESLSLAGARFDWFLKRLAGD